MALALNSTYQNVGFDYILDAMTGSILYALPQYDLTDDVLKELKKNNTGSNN